MKSRPIRNLFIAFFRWFDTTAGTKAQLEPPTTRKRIDWVRCLPFVALHGMCLCIIWVGWSWTAVGACLALYLIRMFAITGFYHRYFSHRTFKTRRWTQFTFAVLGNSAAQRGPLWWAAHHRHHHRHSDQVEDAHSPVQHGLLWSHIGWITDRKNFRSNIEAVPDLAKFPELRFLDRFDALVPVVLGAILFFTGMLLQHLGVETTAMQMLVWGFFVSTVLLFHGTCTINSLSHVFGRRRYKTEDTSRNNWLLAIITLGEGWHNNHHHYQSTVRQGFFWYEIDITFYLLVVMSWLGLVHDLKPVPAQARAVV
jgi:stearoyl-CoA desaturase (Delta-9 desaturase)